MGAGDPNPAGQVEQPELDLYTIPVTSSWFKWEDIHERERSELKEFFEGGSQTRTPKIYKEYRDFFINNFREDPTRRLSFSNARGSLVGDASLLLKVFRFLDRHGLINFPLPPPRRHRGEYVEDEDEDDGNEEEHVRVDSGAPVGVRVAGVEGPAAGSGSGSGPGRGGRRQQAPLASYTDVFEEFGERRGGVPACGSCDGGSEPVRYEYTKGSFVICGKCFENGSFGDGRAKEDFKVGDGGEGKSGIVVRGGGSWSDEETLLLLESVLRHGDDWDLVAKDVPTKSKDDCIAKLIELPFGDLFLGSTPGRVGGNSSGGLRASGESMREGVVPSSENQEKKVDEEEHHEEEQNGDAVGADEGPPLKKQRVSSLFGASSSLMEQVARISTVVGSDITSTAANAAIGAICNEISCPREIFDVEDFLTKLSPSPSLHPGPERPNEVDDSKTVSEDDDQGGQETSLSQNGIPLSLQLRAAVATALGAAAAHARVLAAQEDREIETLMATLLETQLKKLHSKIKDFGELESVMEKEQAELVELKESLADDRIYVLQRIISAGLSKWRS